MKIGVLYHLMALVLVGTMATGASAGMLDRQKQALGLDPSNPAGCSIHAPAANFDTKAFPGGISFFLFIHNYDIVEQLFSVDAFFAGDFPRKGFSVRIPADKLRIFSASDIGVGLNQVADIFVCWGVSFVPASVMLLQIGSSFTAVPPIFIID